MFTGIITHLGRFHGFHHGRKEISMEAGEISPRLDLGESLAVNGVCLSLIRKDHNLLYFNLSRETLDMSSLGSLKHGEILNLELPLTLEKPLSGHLVTGHIDGVTRVSRIIRKGAGQRYSLAHSSAFRQFLVPKGSVALDGVSLTIAEIRMDGFDVEVIPITLENTTIKYWKPGRRVNIECDIIGKYVYNYTVILNKKA